MRFSAALLDSMLGLNSWQIFVHAVLDCPGSPGISFGFFEVGNSASLKLGEILAIRKIILFLKLGVALILRVLTDLFLIRTKLFLVRPCPNLFNSFGGGFFSLLNFSDL